MGVAALVLARPAVLAALRPLLGPGVHAELLSTLTRLASDWAQAVAPGRATVAEDPRDTRAAIQACFEHHGGPLLVAGIGVPRLGAGHAAAALADLGEGADASFGPGMDGGWYMAALSAPRTELLDLAAAAFDGPDVMPRTLEAARAADLDVGLLRMERRLAGELDARAMAADPLTPEPVRRLLGALRSR